MDISSISCEIAFKWMQQELTDWLGAIRQQAITWANVDPDLCRHVASLGQDELTEIWVTDLQMNHRDMPIIDRIAV